MTVYTFDVTNPKPGFATPKYAVPGGPGCLDMSTRRFDVDGQTQLAVDFENDPEYKEIREGLDPAFLEAAALGVDLYLKGDWKAAKTAFQHALELRPGDGPVSHVMSFMKSQDFEVPHDWKGVRDLDGY